MDPQQELFTALLIALRAEGWDVYDGALPPDGTEYPFVYLGDSIQNDTANKSAVFGHITQYIHVYHDNVRKRGTVSEMLLKIKTICRNIGTENHIWQVRGIDQHIMPDTSTAQALMHGALAVDFYFS